MTPCEEDEAFLSSVIRELAEEYDAPFFSPHCTLYSPVTDLSTAKDLIKSIGLNPIEVRKTGIGQSDVIWKTIFIELEKSHELSNFQHQIESHILTPNLNPYSFNPHISLIYKEMPEEQKRSIIRKLDVKDSFLMNTVEIVRTGGTVDHWATVYWKELKTLC
nr:hypothetical protein [Candidatus Neomarinimicrobiota bacterium]